MSDGKSRSYLRSGELARLAGVSPDTIRFYERRGLLPKPNRTSSGYRQYPPQTVTTLLLIRTALGLGFTISELATILRIRRQGAAPCHQVQRIARTKLKQIEGKIRELQILKRDLQQWIKDWDGQLANLEPGEKAFLLEKLALNKSSRHEHPPMLPAGLRRKRRKMS